MTEQRRKMGGSNDQSFCTRQLELPLARRQPADVIRFPDRSKQREAEALKRILDFASRLPGK